ncbi:Uncharacterised protein [Mycobacteroides abscessus subsp. abscessus]|nr:Uncharacterised protein [Mycobacteroides abscessus subsp. abscessus]
MDVGINEAGYYQLSLCLYYPDICKAFRQIDMILYIANLIPCKQYIFLSYMIRCIYIPVSDESQQPLVPPMINASLFRMIMHLS